MLDGAARLEDLFAEAARLGMPALAMTDHGNMFGAYDFYKQARPPGSSRSSASRPTWRRSPGSTRSPGALGPAGADERRRLRRRRVHAHDHAGRRTPTGLRNLFRLSRWPRIEGYFYKPRMDRELIATLRRGHHRHHRLPVRRGADPAAARATTTRRCGGRGRVPGHLRPGQLLPRADGPRPRHRDAGPRRPAAASAASSTCRLLATNDSHYTHAGATPTRTRCCCACSPARPWPTRSGSSSTGDGYYLKSAGRDARACSPTTAARPATTRC